MSSTCDEKATIGRVPNFTNAEKAHLVHIIANKYGAVLEDKKTDRASSTQKIKAWESIEKDFNASSSSTTYRSATCLKKCYENKKKELRKRLSEEKKELILTGGGPPPKIKKDETDEILISILNKKTLIGLENQFDDDADMAAVQVINQENEIEYVFEKPSPLPIAMRNNTPKKSNRRRPTATVRALTSSDVAKKYDLLLDKRLALIENQLKHAKDEHALIIKKRQLEIEILQIELQRQKAQVEI